MNRTRRNSVRNRKNSYDNIVSTDNIGQKHKWNKESNIKTALEILEEESTPSHRCKVLNCPTILFHNGEYCVYHQIYLKKRS